MATKLQDYQAKRKELQATNPNATMLDAKSALSPIINAPVAGQAPVITPIAPEPVTPLSTNQQVLADNQAKVAGEIQAGTRPTVGEQPVATPPVPIAPVPVAPVPVIPTPATVATVTPTPEVKTPKVEPVVIPPTDKKGILNALVTGQPVTPTNTPEYRKASAIHTGFQKFNGMTDVQLLDNLKQGQITTEMGNLLASNPNYQIAKKKLDDIQSTQATNNTMNYLKTGIAGKTVDTPNYLESLSNDLVKKYGLVDQSSQDAFKEIVSNDPEVVDYTKQLHEINRQVADTTQLINDGMKEFKQNYQGKLSASEMLNYMGNRFRDATDNLNALNNTKTYLTADLKNATDMAMSEYGAKQADIAQMNQIKNVVMQSQLGLATKGDEMQMEADFAKKQAEENLNNPAIAIGNMMQMYQDKGIPFTESLQTKLTNFKTSGLSLGQYLDKMTRDIQAKDEYKALTAKKPVEAPTTKEIEVGGKKVTVQWNGKEWTPVQGANIERAVATQTYGTTPAVRNFNPGNIMDTGFGGRKVEGERFTVFDSPQEGFNALVAKIQNIQNGGSKVYSPDMTLLQYIGKYAPSSDNNNPQAYATAIANNLGISINTKIGEIDPVKLAEEHAKHEDGNSYRMLQDLGVIVDGTQGGYSEDDYINKITAMLPAGMKDNKSEMERITKIAKSYRQQGMTPQEASLKFSGYDIQDKAKNDVAMAYIDIGDNLLTLKPKNYESTISKYINSGDMIGLDTYVNGLADDKVKDRYGSDSVLSTTYKVGNDRTDTVVSLINNNKNKIGAFDGRVSDFLNKFKSDPQYQKLKTILTMSQADTRKYFAGSAVTATEMLALQDFIGGKTTMTPENLVIMLETIKEDRDNTFKTQRRGLLPPGQAIQSSKQMNINPTSVEEATRIALENLNK